MMFQTKKVARLQEQVKDLTLLSEDQLKTNQRLSSELRTIRTDYEANEHRTAAWHKVELAREVARTTLAENRAKDAEATLNKRVDAAIAKKTAQLEREFEARMIKLVRDHAEKMGKLDNKLETDKASYRKYLRTENNSTIDRLTTEVRNLTIKNAELEGLNNANSQLADEYKGSNKALTDTMALVVKALPTITAEFTTPTIPSNSVTVGSGNKS